MTESQEELTIKKRNFRSSAPRRDIVESESVRVPSFNVKTFVKKSHPLSGYLTTEAQEILSKDPKERTEKNIDFVEDEVQLMLFFKRLPYPLVRDLCRVLQLHEYSRNQLILRQGQPSCAMYVLVAGFVKVFKIVKSEKTGREREINLDELSHGMQFGAEDLLHDSPRALCVRCRSPTQVLKLEKADFNVLLKDLLLRDEALVEEKFRSFPTLLEFELDEANLTEVMKATKVGKFPPHSIVFGGTKELPYFVHFIVAGECAIEQEVEFTIEHNLGYNRFIAVNTKSNSDVETGKVYKKRIEICRIAPGHYFGMGEDMKQRYVRALEYLETLMIPRYILLEKQPKIFDKMREQMEQSFPSLQQILDKYLEVVNWDKFKNKVAGEVIRTNAVTIQAVNEKKKSKPPFCKYF